MLPRRFRSGRLNRSYRTREFGWWPAIHPGRRQRSRCRCSAASSARCATRPGSPRRPPRSAASDASSDPARPRDSRRRGALVELAAKRGEKGFSRLVGEAIEAYLEAEHRCVPMAACSSRETSPTSNVSKVSLCRSPAATQRVDASPTRWRPETLRGRQEGRDERPRPAVPGACREGEVTRTVDGPAPCDGGRIGRFRAFRGLMNAQDSCVRGFASHPATSGARRSRISQSVIATRERTVRRIIGRLPSRPPRPARRPAGRRARPTPAHR